jgi:hypothetical protein
MGIRNDKLDGGEAVLVQIAQKLSQKVAALDAPSPRPSISRLPSWLIAVAIIAAIETTRPPSRTMR